MSEMIPNFYAPPRTFMGAERISDLSAQSLDYAMLGVPYAEGTFAPYIQAGQSEMPNALRDNPVTIFFDIGEVGLFDVDKDLTLLEGIKIGDIGDVVISPGEGELNRARMTNSVKAILNAGAVPITVGGDHSITYPLVRGFEDSHNKIDFIYFDAHLDFADMPLASEFNHGTQTTHIHTLPFVRNITVIGARNSTAEEFKRAKAAGIRIVPVTELDARGEAAIMQEVIDPTVPTYVSLDIDGMDAIYVPGTTHPESGGMTFKQQKELLFQLNKVAQGNICGFDIVELCPANDVNHITALTASKLTALMMGYRSHFLNQ
ncbi:arginase family protein [Vibrio methylphosphonaticus]|uniref:arginase family protein n=1 Tax=Vibrio methylphosphonaticus TaxID=2946866 RepID=UPI00202A02D3|nr:arginase family protein [Vibrio methylphosphonaticus]MCL9776111.1 arginase family protein [Vibrio methylphosphonaticus]